MYAKCAQGRRGLTSVVLLVMVRSQHFARTVQARERILNIQSSAVDAIQNAHSIEGRRATPNR